MADLDYGEFGSDDGGVPGGRGRVGGLVNLMGAAMSAVLVIGLAVWGYKLLVRDATGVPVVRAMEGPMRVQPADPGGNRPAHQGLAVNRIAAVGEAAPPAEEIVLAPRSADLAPEDLPQAALRAQPVLSPAPAITPAAAPAAPATPIEAAILSATTDVMAAEAELSGEALFEVIPASVPGPSRSLRPRLRPEGLVVRPAAATPAARREVTEVDPASLAAGTRLVQFGAYADAEEARAAWAGIEGRFGTLLEGKSRVIEEAATGGRTFFRLRAAGFPDLADARRFCAALVAERTDCIPVVIR